jgi:hypothetical protein
MVLLLLPLLSIVIGISLYWLLGPIKETPKTPPVSISQINAACLFAKQLLVEIRLANEAKVAAGRRNKNLYNELRPEIEDAYRIFAGYVSPPLNAREIFREAMHGELGIKDFEHTGA